MPDPLALRHVHSSGFLGATTYSDVFGETRSALSQLNGSRKDDEGRIDLQEAQLDAIRTHLKTRPARETCLHVLRTLRSIAGVKVPPETHVAHDGWAASSARAILDSLLAGYAAYLRPDVTDAELEELAAQVSYNTTRPLTEKADATEWTVQFTGRGLRWESLGLLYAYPLAEIGEAEFTDGEIPASIASVSQQWRETALGCLEVCISLALRFSGPNTVLLRLCLKRATEDSQMSGDAGFAAWKGISDATALLTFLGYHADTDRGDYVPSLASEVRRRVTAHVFSLDKGCVLSTGRPPQLSRRYVSTPPPLDIADEELRGDEASRRTALSSLDSTGWNTDGKLHEATVMRGRFLVSLLRDELIEIALSNDKPVDAQTLLDLRRRQLDLYDSLPACLVYQSDGDTKEDIVSQQSQLYLRLEHLLNLFVAGRLMQRFGYPESGEILATSFELVSLTLLFWRNKDRLWRYFVDLPGLAMAYGIPAGGVLCLELLKPSLHGHDITRSAIIQQLSLLVGFLDWVGPNGTNGGLCTSCKAVIQAVLDHTLNPAGDQWLPVDLDAQMDFNFDLMDTFDWLRADDGNEHNS